MAEKILYLSREDVEAVGGADVGDIAAGKKAGRENDQQRTAALNLGVALDDMTTASLIYHRALAQGIGRMLPL